MIRMTIRAVRKGMLIGKLKWLIQRDRDRASRIWEGMR